MKLGLFLGSFLILVCVAILSCAIINRLDKTPSFRLTIQGREFEVFGRLNGRLIWYSVSEIIPKRWPWSDGYQSFLYDKTAVFGTDTPLSVREQIERAILEKIESDRVHNDAAKEFNNLFHV